MAFINESGQSVSYECTDLIDRLEQDIEKVGGDSMVEVITEECDGVTIYKEYFLVESESSMPRPKPSDTESVTRMTATALMELYKTENAIF